MESKQNTRFILEDIFNELIESLKAKRTKIISGLLDKQYETTFKNNSSFFIMLTYLFFQKILWHDQHNKSNILAENEIVDWILKASVKYTSFSNYQKLLAEQKKLERFPLFSLCLNTENVESCRTNSMKPNIQTPKIKKAIVESRECFWQSVDDLKAAEILLHNGFFAQSVNVCQQSIEKGLKSILTINGKSNAFWQTNHCLIELSYRANCDSEELLDMCYNLELLGKKYWKYNKNPKTSTLSIRSRYCDFSQGGVLYLDTLPAFVFDQKTAEKAFELTKNIIKFCQSYLQLKWAQN